MFDEQITLITKEISKRQRFDAWYEAVNLSHMGWNLNEGNDEIDADLRMRGLGRFMLSSCRCYSPCSGSRSSSQAIKGNSAYYGILTVQKGKEIITRRGIHQRVSDSDIYLWDTSEALSFHSFTEIAKNTLFVEKVFLEELFPQVTQMVGKVFNGREGLGPFIHSNLMTLSSRMDVLDRNTASVITDTTLELLTTWLLRLNPMPPQAYRSELFNQIASYIEKNLDDPDLNPGKIAETFGLSLRSLHQLFSSTETSVSRMIRQQRLERCRQEIIKSRNTNRTITDIALRWGFNDPAHFSRCFKELFNVSPSRYLSSLRIENG
ncbi:helix-turn-helix domain-containing protein [Sediminispirochaeta bajacaliforniensis]|uniref:helix-turn-helix domain-containing protein n=1 Tax=Sediminispirochaeta bajacaliforniensis TaxID=148 RepID=UPI00036A56C9|nr:helix-turn-helix domain-containing protein [Sediminispirochaeta bajacaliforniensis]